MCSGETLFIFVVMWTNLSGDSRYMPSSVFRSPGWPRVQRLRWCVQLV